MTVYVKWPKLLVWHIERNAVPAATVCGLPITSEVIRTDDYGREAIRAALDPCFLVTCKSCERMKDADSMRTHFEGQCRYCLCTDDNACEGGCAWADSTHTCCDRCVDAISALSDMTPQGRKLALALLGETLIARTRKKRRVRTARAVAAAAIDRGEED